MTVAATARRLPLPRGRLALDGARVAHLSSPNDSEAVTVVYGDEGRGYVVEPDVPRLPMGQTYQLWALVDDDGSLRPVSAGVLGREIRASVFAFEGPVHSFAVTVEDAPGAPFPASGPRLEAQLS